VAQGLGIFESIVSPTYTIISEYFGRLRLIHIDAYRLSNREEFAQIGGFDLLGLKGALTLIEWSERIPDALPEECQYITLTVEENGDRLLILEGSWIENLALSRFLIPKRQPLPRTTSQRAHRNEKKNEDTRDRY